MSAPGTASSTRLAFLLSPAYCGGKRGELLLGARGASELRARLQLSAVPIAEVFTFLSGLYFRGKVAYALAFASRSSGAEALVIAPGLGLVSLDHPLTLEGLRELAAIGVSPDEPRFCEPLAHDARLLSARLGREGRAILLGSIASDKYVGVLARELGARLRFPAEFVGRGDMSRGGLMLRHAREGRELRTIPFEGAERRGPRPPRLDPLPRERVARPVPPARPVREPAGSRSR